MKKLLEDLTADELMALRKHFFTEEVATIHGNGQRLVLLANGAVRWEKDLDKGVESGALGYPLWRLKGKIGLISEEDYDTLECRWQEFLDCASNGGSVVSEPTQLDRIERKLDKLVRQHEYIIRDDEAWDGDVDDPIEFIGSLDDDDLEDDEAESEALQAFIEGNGTGWPFIQAPNYVYDERDGSIAYEHEVVSEYDLALEREAELANGADA